MFLARKASKIRKIDPKQVGGIKRLRHLLPLLVGLRDVGCERDSAGNRQLYFDEYVTLVLRCVINPILDSVRAGSSYVCRMKENSVFEVIEERLLEDEALQAGVVRDATVRMGLSSKPGDGPPDAAGGDRSRAARKAWREAWQDRGAGQQGDDRHRDESAERARRDHRADLLPPPGHRSLLPVLQTDSVEG